MWEYRSASAEAIFGETLCQTPLRKDLNIPPLNSTVAGIYPTYHTTLASGCDFLPVIILCCNFYILFFTHVIAISSIIIQCQYIFFKLVSVIFFDLFWLRSRNRLLYAASMPPSSAFNQEFTVLSFLIIMSWLSHNSCTTNL